jgi:hypothetical protein
VREVSKPAGPERVVVRPEHLLPGAVPGTSLAFNRTSTEWIMS